MTHEYKTVRIHETAHALLLELAEKAREKTPRHITLTEYLSELIRKTAESVPAVEGAEK
jgi:hypothetical protein